MEALVGLMISVALFRAFEVEGYMISTGSMAPTLYGYHKRVDCPSCGLQFARGITLKEGETISGSRSASGANHVDAGKSVEEHDWDSFANCPNCGESRINITRLPKNHGDQLLVLKNAYDISPPHRWEVIVFRNPGDPGQAYVKRVVGLPGEQLSIVDGDVYADGSICRKDLDTQRGMRISVFDSEHLTEDDSNWQSRWIAESPDDWSEKMDGSFQFTAGKASDDTDRQEWSWLDYEHRIRWGGDHATSTQIPLNVDPALILADALNCPLHWDEDARTLTCIGVMPESWRRRLKGLGEDESYLKLIDKFASQTHVAPVTDGYGYNEIGLAIEPQSVRDLMLETTFNLSRRASFQIEMTDGRRTFQVTVDAAAKELRLSPLDDTSSEPLVEQLDSEILRKPMTLELSLFDRRACMSLNGQPVFEPIDYEEAETALPLDASPVRIAAKSGRVGVERIQLFRDVHYTRGRAKNAVDAPYQLADAEYFVLGDNSPVSLDSRAWQQAAVPAHLLIGKPFVVHLPSRPGILQWGDQKLTVRIPDIERMRLVK
ncbi:signal peptidase I [Calycomorphotria hydatis]|uniref:Signal peptidase I n=1 Tax=Calycomorphotria hydatis TaxID=2528027 RepID=A0A517T708_9PLAN|nr:signal peptidase I [Calycomorphotria hydatis]QDT64158.1 signal peptidase I [Calycomorphotria hydatis]